MGTNSLRLRWRRRDISDLVTPHEKRSSQIIIHIGHIFGIIIISLQEDLDISTGSYIMIVKNYKLNVHAGGGSII